MISLVAALTEVIKIDAENHDTFLAEHPVVFLKAYAPWCGHCQALAPAWKELSEQVETPIAEIDCSDDKNRQVCARYNVTGFPTIILIQDGNVINYQGARETPAMRGWLKAQTQEFIVKIEKADIKADAKKRKLDVFFVIYAPASSFGEYKGKLAGYPSFFYFVEAETPKIVAKQQGYEFTLTKLDNDQLLSVFLEQHNLPFVPEVNKSNLNELHSKPGKTLAILVGETEDAEKLIELYAVNKPGNLKSFGRFQFSKATKEFAAKLIQKDADFFVNPTVIFYNMKNEKKPKYYATEFLNENDLVSATESFDSSKMEQLIIGEKGEL